MLGFDRQVVGYTWTCSATLAIIYAAFLIRKTLLVFIIAILFAYLLFPMVEAIQRHMRLKRRATAVLVLFAFILTLAAAFTYFMGPRVQAEARQLTSEIERPSFREELVSWSPLNIPIGEQLASSQNQIMNFMPQLNRTFRAALRDVINLVLIPIIGFFFLKDGKEIADGVLDLVFRGTVDLPAEVAKRRFIENMLADAHSMILNYMRALLYLCVATQITYSLVLVLLHVKYALLLALIAFPLEFVPLVGPLTSGAIILGVSMFNRYPHIVWIVAFLGVYRIFQDYVLSPHLMNRGVKLHPLLIMFGVFAGGEIGGVGGIFLSIPLLALGRLVYYEWCKRRSRQATLLEPALVR